MPLTDAERRFGARFRSGTEVVLRVLARVVDAQNVFLPAGLSIRAAQAELEAGRADRGGQARQRRPSRARARARVPAASKRAPAVEAPLVAAGERALAANDR